MYSEKRVFIWSWLLLVIAIACAIAGAMGALNDWADRNEGLVFVGVMGLTALFMFVLAIAFFSYRIELKSGSLSFGYSFWNVDVLIDDIESATSEDTIFRNWLGQGWRIDAKKRIGYIASFGAGVEVKLKTGRTYVISCKDPDSLIAAIG